MRAFLDALGFLSLLPLGRRAVLEQHELSAMLAAFPWAGALLGAGLGLFFHGALRIFPAPVAAALAVVAWAWLTRALHLDGVADCVDGYFGGHEPQRRMEIMKDPRTGAFGTVAVCGVLLLKFAALLSLADAVPVFFGWRNGDPVAAPLWGHVLAGALVLGAARCSVLCAMRGAQAARVESSLGSAFLAAAQGWGVRLLGIDLPMLALLASAACFLPALAVLAALPLAPLLVRALFDRALGGQTGDTLGLCIELSEVAALLALAAVAGAARGG